MKGKATQISETKKNKRVHDYRKIRAEEFALNSALAIMIVHAGKINDMIIEL